MESLVIKHPRVIDPETKTFKHPEGEPWSLVIRTHDATGTDYRHVTYLSEGAANMLVNGGYADWFK